jgi:hypothetical protein
MRRFRFSVRDLLWLTLVVAVGLRWFVREQQHRAEVSRVQAEADSARNRASRWRMGAGVLEHVVRQQGREVIWNLDNSSLAVEEPSAELSVYSLSSRTWEPSAKDD